MKMTNAKARNDAQSTSAQLACDHHLPFAWLVEY
jgi:hypothetical protein